MTLDPNCGRPGRRRLAIACFVISGVGFGWVARSLLDHCYTPPWQRVTISESLDGGDGGDYKSTTFYLRCVGNGDEVLTWGWTHDHLHEYETAQQPVITSVAPPP